MQSLTKIARKIKREARSLYLASIDPRVPWFGRAIAAIAVAYAFSPIDLIPDFIPILGYLDDLILVPLLLWLALKIIPKQILDECREKATVEMTKEKQKSWVAAGVIIVIWLILILLTLMAIARIFKP